MKLKFKKQAYQINAVEAVVNCFAGQLPSTGFKYDIDPGLVKSGQDQSLLENSGFRNHEISKSINVLENIHAVQHHQNLPLSSTQVVGAKTGCAINLDIEMETGTGKTYCYIKTIFELNKRYGWSKFIIVVPSIAIREGVYKSLTITADHFLEDYKKKIRFFIYNSKLLTNLESFSSDANINVMVINVQAFNATGKDNRRIYEELDDFQSRRPIDVIAANRPILILDEPQKMEGVKTLESFKGFNPLMILRYSATHKSEHNKIHRLDALDAYNQKLVKKIAVRGISVKNLTGTHAYLYLGGIGLSSSKPPVVQVELEIKQKTGIKRVLRTLHKGDNLYDLSGGLDQYKQGFVVADINANSQTLSFTNGVELVVGDATGDVDEAALRRIQIREAIKAHFEKEQALFHQGIKVLSLFFIDSVAKYRCYDEHGESSGEYAAMFEEEYNRQLNDVLTLDDNPYNAYLRGIETAKTHQGYFSIDKKSKRLVDPVTGKKSTETDDVAAYDLILKDKERLLSLTEPVRFIFSHSALREGWDNPNVFVICTLKHSDNSISRRQEVGRGMRLSVNQLGERMDKLETVHAINVLTVVTSESYTEFVTALQRDMSESLSERPRIADEKYFKGKVLVTPSGDVVVTPILAKQLCHYLIQNGYTDLADKITQTYHDAKKAGQLAELPPDLALHAQQVFQLIDTVFSDAKLPPVDNGRTQQINPLNANFEKQEFIALWQHINHKAAYTVNFSSEELIAKCVAELDKTLSVSALQYTIKRGEQKADVTYEEVLQRESFKVMETQTEVMKHSVHSAVNYDLIGKLVAQTQLTRRTVAQILQGLRLDTFSQYKTNPEAFIAKASQLINEQKATVVIEHLSYDTRAGTFDTSIFTQAKTTLDFSTAGDKLTRHIYDYLVTDSNIEREFAKELDTCTDVVVYAKLPKDFYISTPVGNYNPDWAISFKEGVVNHVYFVAETKGSMSSLELRKSEDFRIDCATKFFEALNKLNAAQVSYAKVDSYGELMALVKK